MDINKALADLRASVQRALQMGYQAQLKMTVAQLNTQLLEVAEGFDNLDIWLVNGGFLPRDWDRPEVDAPVLRAMETGPK